MRIRLAIALVATLAAPAHAGSILGNAKVPSMTTPAPQFRPYAGRASSLPAPAETPRGRVTDAVLYLERLSAGMSRPAADSVPQLAQLNQAFTPRVVVVPVGGSVEFPNLDRVYHNVFSVSPASRFDLGKYPRGQSRSVKFTKPGVVNVFCDIHADMAAFIVVVPTLAWTRPGENGAYALPGLPAGRYRLHWWHPDFPAGQSDIVVPASGDVTLDVSF